MKWLQDNPLGMVLASASGLLILLSLSLAVAWTRPVEVESDAVEAIKPGTGETAVLAHQVGPLSNYQVVNQRPVFNESRLPEVIGIEDSEPVVDTAIEVKDPPDVKLTGVIITPALKIASLTPSKGKKDSVMAHEGESMTGEYVGWLVSSIKPRSVVLESRKGETLELDLEVYDTRINQPSKPVPAVTKAQTAANQAAQQGGEDGQPTDRAEQIRQRIAERREELRREQEDKQAAGRGRDTGREDYQNAIRAMMNNSRKDNDSNDD